VDPLELRATLARFPTGVTVVGTRHVPEGVCGLTANAFTSVSLEPPLALVCVDLSSSTHACIEASGRLSVSILSTGQEDVALWFAHKDDDKFARVAHRIGPDGLPLVDGAAAWLECTVEGSHPGGDHTIFVARVDRVERPQEELAPLVFHRGSYTTVQGLPVLGG
jgi:flavin reductase (DIM6/NTAB) family NADH-FMN oxidoreductase RutF